MRLIQAGSFAALGGGSRRDGCRARRAVARVSVVGEPVRITRPTCRGPAAGLPSWIGDAARFGGSASPRPSGIGRASSASLRQRDGACPAPAGRARRARAGIRSDGRSRRRLVRRGGVGGIDRLNAGFTVHGRYRVARRARAGAGAPPRRAAGRARDVREPSLDVGGESAPIFAMIANDTRSMPRVGRRARAGHHRNEHAAGRRPDS